MGAHDLVHFGGFPGDETIPSPLPELALENDQLDFTQDEQLPENLLRMCGSVYLEPRREATSVLARGTRTASNVSLVSNLVGVSILVTLCNLLKNCHDLKIIRNAAVVLNNMFTHDAQARSHALDTAMFKDLCATFLKWSGAEDLSQVTSSTLVCQELIAALETLVQDPNIVRNASRDRISTSCLQKIVMKSPGSGPNWDRVRTRAKQLVGKVT